MPDAATLAAYGLPGLFAVAFLAGSIVPIPSEALMIALLLGGTEPVFTVAVAAAGNFLGAATLFWLGRRLGRADGGGLVGWATRATRSDPARLERAIASMRRWGPPALLLSWAPLLGDLLVVGAGAIRVGVVPFALFTAAGKSARFAAVAAATLAAAGA
ncbi:MAG TPA: VTT domain-containing protein [Vulgatibacter sp.]|nr:VTT domain-containing protein [Vulgatibacter sp.]